MTGRDMKLRVIKGSMSRLTPKVKAAALAASRSRFTCSRVSSLIRPAMARTTSPRTWPSSMTAMPPRFSATRLTAAAMSDSLVPTTMMLWESWETLVATAPRFRP